MAIEFQSFSFGELDQVARVPGIYAWYAKFSIGLKEWQTDFGDGGVDLGVKKFSNKLKTESSKYGNIDLKMRADLSFGVSWRGTAKDILSERVHQVLDESFDKELAEKEGREKEEKREEEEGSSKTEGNRGKEEGWKQEGEEGKKEGNEKERKRRAGDRRKEKKGKRKEK